MDALTNTVAKEFRDVYGRQYRVGERAQDLIGRSRHSQVWGAWACLVVISPLQYSFGMAALGMPSAHGWSLVQTMWLLGLFVACQALVAVPTAHLHRSGAASPAQLVAGGGVLAAGGLVTLAHVSGIAAAVVGYALVGGVGAGMVYSACITTVAKWFPDNRVATIGFVTGGFACGAVPTIVLLGIFSSSGAHTIVFDGAALVAFLTVMVAGLRLQDPPRHWWPEDVDPQSWAVDHRLNQSLPNNMPAVRHYEPGEAIRTGALPLMWLILALITAVSLLGIAFVAGYAVSTGFGAGVAASAAGLLAAVNGVGRAFAGRLSDRFGRCRVLAAVLVVEGLAQFGLVGAAEVGSAWAFAVCAMFAGLGGGAFYAIFANLVLEYFGENSLLQNQAILYTAKAVGGLVGVGGAASLVAVVGHRPVFLSAGLIGLVTAAMVRFLKQPGRPSLPVREQLGAPVV
jgi:MFS family permease